MKIYFVSTNRGKFIECREMLSARGIKLAWKKLRLEEIQADSLERVALWKVREAFGTVKKPVFVEDAGLFVKALKGFPGVYSSYAYKTLGCEGILKLMEHAKNREAQFKAVIAFASKEKKIKLFRGICNGFISREERGSGGFGFDPIFIPRGHEKTFAEDPGLKQRVSHRARALEKFANFLVSEQM